MRSFFLATYLAVKEVFRNKDASSSSRWSSPWITMLVCSLPRWGEGLSNANRQYVANLDAQLIVFLEKSDYLINASRLETNTVKISPASGGVADAGPIYISNSEIVSLPEPLKISMLARKQSAPECPNCWRTFLPRRRGPRSGHGFECCPAHRPQSGRRN